MMRFLCAAMAAMMLAGCAGTPQPAADAAIQSDADAYYLIAVYPPKAVVSIVQGKMDGGDFYADGTLFVTQSYVGSPVDGFILAKAPPGTIQGIRMVRMTDSPWAPVIFTCSGDAKTLVFDTVGGKVIYGGAVRFVYAPNGGVAPVYSSDIEPARAFLQTYHPQLVDKLVMGQSRHVAEKRC